MATAKDIAAIQKCVRNRLDDSAIREKAIAGVMGDAPSHYSKSPQLWNAAFHRVNMNAIYLPFDVDDAHVENLLAALRDSERCMGINVTVPYKARVIDYLDDVDPGARRIHAVNTIVRNRSGRLIGYNTDGEGFVESILTCQPERPDSFIPSLKGMNVLLLGAGGSARAVALHVANLLDGGELVICNRTVEHASSLAADIRKGGPSAIGIAEKDLPTWAPKADLIINSTTKGQGGVRKLPNGSAITLEPYSALASAQPSALPSMDSTDTNFEAKWHALAAPDIEANNRASLSLAQSIPSATRFYDLIYYPEETIFLRHGRVTGHPTMNGKSMIINQAVIGFCKRICQTRLQALGIDTAETYKQLLDVMYRAW